MAVQAASLASKTGAPSKLVTRLNRTGFYTVCIARFFAFGQAMHGMVDLLIYFYGIYFKRCHVKDTLI